MGERLTKRDIEKIEEEIEHRKLVIRKEAIEAVKEARAQGDLSENFEYYAAKKHKNQNESRIRYLERMLKTATVVDDSSKSDEVGAISSPSAITIARSVYSSIRCISCVIMMIVMPRVSFKCFKNSIISV